MTQSPRYHFEGLDAEHPREKLTRRQRAARINAGPTTSSTANGKIFQYEGRLVLNSLFDPCPLALTDPQWFHELIAYINDVDAEYRRQKGQ